MVPSSKGGGEGLEQLTSRVLGTPGPLAFRIVSIFILVVELECISSVNRERGRIGVQDHIFQGSTKKLQPSLVNFVPSVSYLFGLSLPAAIKHPGRSLLALCYIHQH